jgi:hypothetical protein
MDLVKTIAQLRSVVSRLDREIVSLQRSAFTKRRKSTRCVPPGYSRRKTGR